MILKKPYATFIKYFKLLHGVMAVFIGLLLYRTFKIYGFFKVYSVDYRSVMSSFSVREYAGYYTYFFIFVIILLTVALFSVMFYKKKPFTVYIYNIVLYILVFVLYSFSFSTFENVSRSILDVRVAKAFRDISFILGSLQIVSFVLIIIRTTGFDIKKFDFGTDLQQLDISEKDSEEIELALEFDRDKIIRKIKNFFRNIKYFYFENKFIFNCVILASVVVIGLIVHFTVGAYRSDYSQGVSFDSSGFSMNVIDSYILDSDLNGRKIVETEGDYAGAVVAVRFHIKGYSVNQLLDVGLITLRIGDLSYSHNYKLANEIYDLGTPYYDQKLTSEYQTYIIAFEISDTLAKRKMELKINDNTSFVHGKAAAKNSYVALKPIDLRKEGKEYEGKLGSSIRFDDSILGSASFIVKSYEIKDNYKLTYKFCYGTGKCFDSYSYLTPTATGSYLKSLMKINGNITFDQNVNISSISNLQLFLNKFGYICYKKDDKLIKKKIETSSIKSKNVNLSDYYIEIPRDAVDSSELYFVFEIRNQTYKYTLK